MNSAQPLGRSLLACALSASLICPLPAGAQVTGITDISNAPVTQPATSSMQPNILLILDDSGSMQRQFTPDYVTNNDHCFDSADGDNLLDNTMRQCWAGDPPAMSPDFNTQYYNPDIRYRPAVDYTGIERISMTAANTVTWTQVKTDNVSAASADDGRSDVHSSRWNYVGSGTPVTETLNLVTGFPDRVYCTTQADAATDTALCKTNLSYSYPNQTYPYALDASSNRKYRFGAPYYYRIVPEEFCTDARMNDCVAATSPTVVSGVSYSVPAPVRFCTDSTLATCHAKRSVSGPDRQYPKFAGNLAAAATLVPIAARATIYLGVENPPGSGTYTAQPDTALGTITSIIVTKPDGVTHTLSGPGAGNDLTLPASQSNCQWAELIENRIDAQTGVSGFTAAHSSCGSSNTVVITAPAGYAASPTAAESYNGATITISTNVTGTTPASVTFTFSSTVSTACGAGPVFNCGNVSSLQVNGIETVLTPPIKCPSGGCSGTYSARNIQMAGLVFAGITAPAGWNKDQPATNQVRLTATTAAPLGSGMNGLPWSIVRANTSTTSTSGTFSNGATTGDVVATTTSFSGGQNEAQPGDIVRSNVGNFSRVNIVPGPTYNRSVDRGDCVAVPNACTYEEEMTNFANWFSYYRTRVAMAKTAIGRAFALSGIPATYRVGFMTINFSTSKYLSVAPFTGTQKQNWFTELYEAPANPSTPLRDALSRAGRYFGDRYNGASPATFGASPINSACQPNFAILTSDGYWNDASGDAKDLAGNAIGDADGDGRSNTLADIAHYYYNTDLRPIPPVSPSTVGYKNQVPPSGEDTAPHQHMTTFTVGMGVSGSLLFHPNYQTPGNSLDYDSVVASAGGATGSSLWPTPASGTETTVDDMWHAAVNGKGRFFSAQNPLALAAGINEVLSSVQKRVGAGAAAATSNLQPVAGDNFAFTAQYQTVEWSGDLKARTISLTDGVVGVVELWSAQEQLDLRTFSDRVIYTYDANDTDATATTLNGDGDTITQNANKLRSFCRPGAPLSTYPTCTDGGLITDAEKDDFFDPLGGVDGGLTHAVAWPGGDSRRTAANQSNHTYLFRFLRGERAREITLGGTSSTDLWRPRTHILGDIVNAQPAYVKSSPFSYSAATDPYYTAFQATTNGQSATRKGTVYVAANDGMLHAFETDPDNIPYYQDVGVSDLTDRSNDHFVGTKNLDPIAGEGAERWAYVPQLMFPTLKWLAEENYKNSHMFFTDGSPAIGDVCFDHSLSAPCSAASKWRTILVAGFNAGGRGFYALDITLPDSPKALWELRGGSQAVVSGSVKCLTDIEANSGNFSEDCNIGYSFGNPIIAKRPEDGKWVVLLTSGYNNVSPGTSRGYLYVVEAQTGKILRRMTTGVGCTITTSPDGNCTPTTDQPSGLARINAWVDSATTNNTALAIYGGDLYGNLWRFQLDDTVAVPRYSVTRLASVEDDAHVRQPITAKPELATVNNKRVVYIGTGRFLGDLDKGSLQKQSIYAIMDSMTGVVSPQIDMARTGVGAIPTFVRQTLTEDTTSTRTVTTPQLVSFGSDNGWFIDLPDGGTAEESAERVSVDPIIQLGTLVIASNVPSTETCLAGGSGWVNFLDIRSGATIPGTSANPASVKVAGSLIVGINIVKIGDQVKTIVTTADNQQLTQATPVAATGVQGRRVTWRELIVE